MHRLTWFYLVPVTRGHDPYSVIRDGDWKLIKFYDPQKLELYNLADDLGERNDLAKREPHKVRTLESKLSEHLKTAGARLPRPGSGEKSD